MPNKPATRRNMQGFSLVELAIVLAILGLLVGGVVVAQSLVRSSGLQSATAEMQNFRKQIGLFSERYHSLPGDMPDATTVLGSAAANGNGNRRIAHNSGADAEEFDVWPHLRLAGLINGTYTGTLGSPAHQLGSTIPASSRDGSGFRLFYHNGTGLGIYAPVFTLTNQHLLIWAALNSADGTATMPVLSPSDARAVDEKLDDGIANSGSLLANIGNSASGDCNDTTTDDYRSGNDDVAECVLYWRLPDL